MVIEIAVGVILGLIGLEVLIVLADRVFQALSSLGDRFGI